MFPRARPSPSERSKQKTFPDFSEGSWTRGACVSTKQTARSAAQRRGQEATMEADCNGSSPEHGTMSFISNLPSRSASNFSNLAPTTSRRKSSLPAAAAGSMRVRGTSSSPRRRGCMPTGAAGPDEHASAGTRVSGAAPLSAPPRCSPRPALGPTGFGPVPWLTPYLVSSRLDGPVLIFLFCFFVFDCLKAPPPRF